ncbi:S-layer protein [Janthinobacterium sp. BJB412]|nr:S-layer protein [Janthinobacterium sp. BJB412]
MTTLAVPAGLALGLILGAAGCGSSDQPAAVAPPVPLGKWSTGDLHSHTTQSADAGQEQTLDLLLSKAFASYGLDWLAVSNHLRPSTRDNNGAALPAPIAMAQGIERYELPRIAALQAAGTYADKLAFSAFEWDMPKHDHIGIGLFAGGTRLATATRGVAEFEYLFTNRDPALFAAADVAAWGAKYAGQRFYSTADDALKAVAWLRDNYPDNSYAVINHPSRNRSYRIDDFRQFNDMAPSVFFAIEGMVGNQMEPDRGGYGAARTADNAELRTYGGVDHVVAQLGGVWDALLGEGRRIWNVADSDAHFKTTELYSSGYFPGEYAKNHVWIKADGIAGLLDGLRSGKSFAVFGDLINALDFKLAKGAEQQEMGGELKVAGGEQVTVTIRFKSPAKNNYEKPINSGVAAGVKPLVDHVDLIAGDVGAKAAPGTPAYGVALNPSTRVLKRFTSADWTVGADGYASVSYTLTAAKSQYFRLRGSNLGTDVAGKTQNGEPLADAKTETADHQQRFNDINDRNYASLWFYSNPIFMTVR